MIGGELHYAVTLTDGISTPARAGATSLGALTRSLGDAKTSSGEMGKKLLEVVEPTEIARHAFEALGAGLREIGSAIASGDIKGVITGFAEALGGAAEGLDLLIPGLGQATGAVIRFGGAILGVGIEALEELVKTSLEVTDTNARLSASFEALGGKGAGTKTLAFVDDLAKKLPQSRKEIAGWVSEFQSLGITDLGQIREQVLATASAQAITFAQGGQGAAVYTKLAERIHIAVEEHKGLKLADKQLKQLYEAGLNVTEIAAKMGLSTQQLAASLKAGTVDAQKFGDALTETLVQKGKGPLEAMGDSLGSLYEKAKETWAHLFDGIDASPITNAIRSVISLGDTGEPSGRALKDGIQFAIQGVINFVGKAITELEVLFLTVELGVIENKPLLIGIASVFGLIADSIIKSVAAISEFVSYIPKLSTMQLALSAITGGIVAPTNAAAGDLTAGAGGAGAKALPAHAEGGTVMQPAAGEMFASVQAGEQILPRGQSGGGMNVEHLELHVHAAGGVTDATALSATGLSIAFERFALGSGR